MGATGRPVGEAPKGKGAQPQGGHHTEGHGEQSHREATGMPTHHRHGTRARDPYPSHPFRRLHQHDRSEKYQQLFIKRRPGPAAACARRRRATERSPAELPGGPPGGVQRGHTSGNIERARRIDNRRAAASVMKYLDIPPMVVLPSCTRLLDALRNYAVKSTRGSLTRVHIKQQQQKNIYYKNDDSSKCPT